MNNLDFWQWFQSRHPSEFTVLVMPIFFIVMTIVVTTGIVINSIHRRRAEVDLKRELLERGMSADEIATVVRATSTRHGAKIDRTNYAKGGPEP